MTGSGRGGDLAASVGGVRACCGVVCVGHSPLARVRVHEHRRLQCSLPCAHQPSITARHRLQHLLSTPGWLGCTPRGGPTPHVGRQLPASMHALTPCILPLIPIQLPQSSYRPASLKLRHGIRVRALQCMACWVLPALATTRATATTPTACRPQRHAAAPAAAELPVS